MSQINKQWDETQSQGPAGGFNSFQNISPDEPRQRKKAKKSSVLGDNFQNQVAKQQQEEETKSRNSAMFQNQDDE